ncbi:MAG: hypothetical protein VXZ41_02420 [Pseudomonadota bacterium]|nr:hypothetical protein [Pseudomonadota bacterium]
MRLSFVWSRATIVLGSAMLWSCSNEPVSGKTQEALDPITGNDEVTVEVIATGANIAGANGVGLGPDGHLYVASVLGSNMTVLDTESGAIVEVYDALDGVIGPDDVAFGPDGSWYWTSIMTGEVAGFNASGEKVIAAQLSPGVNPITFSDDGRLFVSQCFFGTHLFEVDPTGQKPARTISDDLGPGCGLNGMDWGPDGRLYGPRWFRQQVVSFDVDDNTMRLEASGFDTPAAIKFDKQGVLHVLDTGAGALFKVVDGNNIQVAELSPGLDNFAIDDQGRIFVSSFTDGFVKRINLDGSITELQPGGMSHAGGLAYHKGAIVAADLHAIRAYKPSGEEAFTQRNVLGTGTMGGALNVSSDGDNLVLVSWVDNDVRVWDPVAKKRIWEKAGLAAPVAAVRFGDEIVVAEHGRGSVVGYAANGEEASVYANSLAAPTGLLIEGDDLFVSDRASGQILQIAAGGKVLTEARVVAADLTTPEGFVKFQEKFAVFEADTGQVVVVDNQGAKQVVAKVPEGSQAASPAQPPSQVFNGITVDAEGTLFVAGESNRVLYRIANAF